MSLKEYLEITEFLKGKGIENVEIGIILGTGISKMIDYFDVKNEVPYSKVPGFPVSTVKGHEGKVVFSTVKDKKILLFCGRFHYYEGYSMRDVVLPVRISKLLGAKILVVTNAAGGLNPSFKPGDIMVITDHINLFPENPLRGELDECMSTRFPSMIDAYDSELRSVFVDCACDTGIDLKEGVYVGWQGPNLETQAEYRFLKMIGADAVGMSTVPEVISAKSFNLKVLGVSIITNMGVGKITPHSHDDVIKIAQESSELLGRILIKWIERL